MSEAAAAGGPTRISPRRVIVLLSGRLVAPLVTLAVFAVVGRRGEAGQLGLFYYAYNLLTMFQVLANFGYDSFLMREVARTPGRARELLNNSLLLLAPYGVLLGLAMPVVVRLLGYSPEIHEALWAGSVAIPCMAVAYAFEAVLIGQERFGVILGGALLDGSVRLALSFLAFDAGGGTRGLLGAVAAGRLAAVLWYVLALLRRPGFRPLGIGRGILRHLVEGASPFLMMYVAYALATRMDGALLARLSTPEEGDAYTIPNRLTLAVWLVSGSIVGTIFPAMARAGATPLLASMVVRCVRLFAMISLPAAALLSAYPDGVLALLGGQRNAAVAAPILASLAWVVVPLTMNEPLLRGLLAAGGQRAAVGNAFTVLGSAVLLMTIAVRAAGARGAAVALPVVIAIDCLLNARALHEKSSLAALPRTIAPIGLAALLSLPLISLLAPRFGPLSAAPPLVLYAALLVLLRVVSIEELRQPRRLLLLSNPPVPELPS